MSRLAARWDGRRAPSWLLLLLVLLAPSLALAEAATARFRVTDVQLLKDNKAKVSIFWEYNDGSASGSTSYSGKGVRFYLHRSLPGYGNAPKGTPIKQTLDMTNGNGLASLVVNLPKGAAPGQGLVLTGVWPGYGHEWGSDAGRAGGQFKLPMAPTGGLKVHVNQATAADFAQLPGVGPSLAQRLVTFRDQQKGKKIHAVRQLAGVAGISPKKLKKLEAYLTLKAPRRRSTAAGQISVNVNSATLSQLQALPGIGPGKAQAIIDLRNKRKGNRYGRRLNNRWDLHSIAGINSNLTSSLQPYIKFKGRTKVPRATRNSALRVPHHGTLPRRR